MEVDIIRTSDHHTVVKNIPRTSKTLPVSRGCPNSGKAGVQRNGVKELNIAGFVGNDNFESRNTKEKRDGVSTISVRKNLELNVL